MARTKIKRRTYNLNKQQNSENKLRTAQNTVTEELPQEASVSPPQECPIIQAKQPEAPAGAAPLETLPLPAEELEVEKETLSKSMCLSASTIENQEETSNINVEEAVAVTEDTNTTDNNPQENSLKNDDSIELDWSIQATQGAAGNGQSDTNADEEVHSISRDSPLNLAWDSSMKENCRQQANAPNFRPITPDNLLVPVDEIFSPTTQKQIRTTIRALFPNGPPPPPPVRPMRRPKKGDVPYIVNCTKRPRVPSPKSLDVFTGDKYGITSTTNCDENEEQCTPEKKPRRGPYGGPSISKSTFNRQTNEIAERLKLYEKIDRLVGRSPKVEPVGYMKRAFSPLPSTSTDNETIMKNDKHFSESLNCDNFDIDEDEELPEVIWETDNIKKEKDQLDLSSPLKNRDIETNKYTDSILTAMNEDMNNNNDVIAIDDEFCEIQFDKFMPKEKILDYSDCGPKKEPELPTVPFSLMQSSKPSTDICATTSTDVICVDNTCTTQAHSNSVTSPVLRAINKNATATATKQSDLVIEVPEALEPINMSRHAPIRAPSWNEEVQFVSEERIEGPNNSTAEDLPEVQIVSQTPAAPDTSSNGIFSTAINELQQFLTCLHEACSWKKTKKKNTKTKSKENSCAPSNTENVLSINDENTAPVNVENVSNVNGENATVSQVQPDTSLNGVAESSPGKQLGECPICLENLRRGSIASTTCGHVFCLECIRESLRSSGKRCPTCRKQLRGVGYHQVFL
ncbi:E3 ubiquitin-protein ligase BRE1-like isoform X2 [Leguminivora glycinivorella]|uniref:E3 ubiquitin-protein ligase BRE1-like isoform X2 n=1 Tax=Leguminivora glycinivorella TaxID=1035111 RepID=UPI00200F7B11|nr:E3 ubiquitin-protein ligase BRE1-like isoform X2 [Leguminivora glycinivorella]